MNQAIMVFQAPGSRIKGNTIIAENRMIYGISMEE